MSCNPATLYTDACTNGLAQSAGNEQQFRALVLQLLCEISQSGGSAVSGLWSGDYGGVEPNFSPTSDVAIAFDEITGTQWNWYQNAWH